MSFQALKNEIMGHQKVMLQAEKALQQGGLAGLTLFVGPEGVGKKKVAFALAQYLLCTNDQPACGQCGPCQRVRAGSSESLLFIEPQGAQIKVDQAREIFRFCQLSNPGRARVVIVDRAELLNKQAANSLLKILEEPPAATHFFFIVPHPKAVLPTLRSRAQVLRFGALDMEELSQKLSVPQWIIEASAGRMDRIEQLQDEDVIELRMQALKTLKTALSERSSLFLEDLKKMTLNREAARTVLRFWKEFLRDVWVGQQNIARSIHPDIYEELEFLTVLPLEEIAELFQKLSEIERAFQTNVDVQISFENFLRYSQRNIV